MTGGRGFGLIHPEARSRSGRFIENRTVAVYSRAGQSLSLAAEMLGSEDSGTFEPSSSELRVSIP